jgi:PKD repeat protein
MALVFLALAAPFGPARAVAATAVLAGYEDFVFNSPPAAGADDVTAGRVQSKLWTNDGKWWGLLFDSASTQNAKFRIWKFDMATQNWSISGVTAQMPGGTAVDDRNRSHADALSVGNTLYVASSRAEDLVDPIETGRDLRIYRYAYNTTTDTYTLATGFPKTIASTPNGTGYSTIARDGAGTLWVTFTQANKVKITRSTDNGVTWSAPIDLPGMGNDVAPDDVAGVVSLTGGVGVLWSNQAATDDSFYFAAHVDGDPAGTWQARETAFGTPSEYDADGHVSIKTDASGNLIAAIKTGRNDDPAPNGSDPLIAVLKRTGAANAVGAWESHTVTTVTLEGTRPVLVLDAEANQANVFLTFPTLEEDGDQAIYRRTAPLATLNFGTASIGTPFIDSADKVAINDATSTKGITEATLGMIVGAVDEPTRTYFHGCAGAVCPDAPVANFTGTPTSGNAPLTVDFTDTSTNTPSTWSWTFGDGGTSTQQNPSHTYSDAGTYTVSLTAGNVAGSDVETKAAYITVDPPLTSTYEPITPIRVLDSRDGTGGTMIFTANQPQTFNVAGVGAISADAVAVTGNLTVVGQTAAGFVALGPESTSSPGTSTLNFPTKDIRANGVTIPLDGDGDLSAVYKAVAGNTTHLLLDVTGFFVEGSTGATFFPMTPLRVLDSRDGTGGTLIFTANQSQSFPVAGVGTVSAVATAVTGNLTVVGQTAAGYVALGPVSTTTPTTSTLNFPTADVRANGVTVPLDGSGDLHAVYKAAAGKTTHLIFDVTGYFVDGPTGAEFVPVPPARILDTRIGLGWPAALAHGTPATWSATGHDGVETDAVAIVGNATVVGQTKAGFVAITPDPLAVPPTSTLNFPLGDIRANGFSVEVSGTGTVSGTYRATSGATTHLVVDVMGYYR